VRRQIVIGPDTKIARAGGRPPRVVAVLLVEQIGLFIAWAFADAPAWVAMHLAASAAQCLGRHELWQPFTALWVHLGARSLLLNALTLWIFGSALERWWGGRRFLLFWIVTGVMGLAAGVAAGLADPQTVVAGSAGSATAMMVAFAFIYPEHLVFFYGVMPIKAKHMVLALLGFVLIGSLLSRTFIELAVQLVGGAAALLFLFRPQRTASARVADRHASEEARRKLRVIQGGKREKKEEKRYWN